MDCQENSDCLTDRGYCHPKTKMCLCKNGLTSYPACNLDKGNANDCQQTCSANEFCDKGDSKCVCNLGGFPPNCHTKKCELFKVEHNGECVCMYGKTSNGSCRKCRSVCGKNAVCRSQGNKYISLPFLNI